MDGIAAYREVAATAPTPGDVVRTLYGGAIKFLNRALVAMEADDTPAAEHFVERTVAILQQLKVSLDCEVRGEIADNLRRLYGFMIGRLPAAARTGNSKAIQDMLSILENLHESWKAIAG